jgi:D-alanyl-D-alanine carboxypeptidase/D-alanyl-D-alanine-endopeptidase (penicillin-binding protein 4)
MVAAPDAVLEARVRAALAVAGTGPRWGLVVAAEDGTEVIAIAPDERFVPASNTKVFTTAAAMATLPMDAPDTSGARVRLSPRPGRAPDVVLSGHGDARLSSAADCVVDCLATLADAVAARVRVVGNVVGDDTAFPDQRWSAGMSWNNMATRSGTAVSALTMDDDELVLTVTPGQPGRGATIAGSGYYRIDNQTVTAGVGTLGHDRMPGSDTVRVEGAIAPAAAPATLRIAVEDPAHHAAWTLAAMLRARGVRVTGAVVARHRPVDASDDSDRRGSIAPRPPEPAALARLTPPPLGVGLRVINKFSQNVHAELLLRRMGTLAGTGSVADGLAVVRGVIAAAGVPRVAFDLSDGSGMSTYNRISPRGMVTFLRWVGRQPWGEAWFATLPIGGVDGTLARRFRDTPLAGRIMAKTGSLSGTTALAGRMTAASGRALIVAAYANDVPEGVSASAAMDAALVVIAAAH